MAHVQSVSIPEERIKRLRKLQGSRSFNAIVNEALEMWIRREAGQSPPAPTP